MPVLDDVLTLLGDNRDYVLLALAVLVLAEGGIIVLWARRATRLRGRMERAVAEAERSAASARAAAATVTEQSQGVYRVAERLRIDTSSPAATGATETAPSAADNVPAPAAPAPATPHPEPTAAYTTPGAEKAAAWVLPDVEASTEQHEPAIAEAPTHPAPEGAAPTTLAWSAAAVPVEPADDFAVITDPATVSRYAPPARPAQVAASHAGSGGNGSAAPTAEPALRWDTAILDSNDIPADELPRSGDVLLVEDDPIIARLYRTLLEGRGYTVRHAEDGLEGLDLAGQRRPDLVLLDIMMPRMNGIAFLQALRAGPMRNVPVVVLSNFMEKQLVDDAMRLGALEYMVKAQTRPEALVGALPHWLRGERAFSF
jgi:CheY-like chemotaxis protein